ncbi:MAG: urea carboxylase-associated family protein [Bosea sp. (in: a-proteobacteria)]|nr:urea carboxylase-associated family protein [Bosea sp. (in: a-proteobacteria)]
MVRTILLDFVLEPGMGKALEIRKGQILRLEQIEGGQCLDFNCFNLHDYKEYFHAGRTRTLHGLHPTKGDFLWSAPPRERAMMFIAADTAGANDVLFPRCSANLYESVYGYCTHTNCQDIQAEAQREYGLTPDDVHDSFNLFMETGVDAAGRPYITRQRSKPGDHVDFLALMDVLAVPNICGSDVMRTSNFSLKPARVSVLQATEADLAAVPILPAWRTQRTVADFKQQKIKPDRELRRDPAYVAEFANAPIRTTTIDVALDEEEQALLGQLKRNDLYEEDGAALRDILFSWWEEEQLGR